ncbi:MAG: flagellar basal body-associated FliL family protein [Pikeienuella sp.]|uniref:flagellar basal body-associated FliL family protein n=1 Tax=Pikeienuella sp. TaxID=2831957 RepID=UPI00391A180B
MKKLLIPVVLALVGLAGGLFAGHSMKPAPEPEEGEAAEATAEKTPEPAVAPDAPGEYVKLERQFIVPVIADEKVGALMVLQMAVEMAPDAGGSAPVFEQEPKLRDEFLRVLFLHAQSGGFDGSFTEPRVMDDLRASLTSTAKRVIGPGVRAVLITSIIRQDI